MPRRISPTSPIKSASPNSLLIYLRTRRRLSQTKLSKLTDVNLNIICQCELRGIPLSLENLRRLADFFEVSLDALARSDLSSLVDLPPIVQSVFRRQARNTHCEIDSISQTGKDFVAQQEQEKFKGTSYEGKVSSDLTISAKGCCDIVSFDPAARRPIFIKTKSTEGEKDEPIGLSRVELGFLKRCIQDNIAYELHRVYHAGTRQTAQTVYTAQQILDIFDFESTAYITCRKETDCI